MKPARPADTEFAAIHNAEWAWRKTLLPPDEDSTVSALGPLPDVGEAQQQAKLARWQDVLVRLRAIDVSALSGGCAADYLVYRYQIETLLAELTFKTYQRPLSGDTSFWRDLANLSAMAFRNEEDYDNYITLLNDLPRYFEQNIANMRAGTARGFTLPQITLAGRDRSVASVLEADYIEDSPFFRPFKTMPAAMTAERQCKMREHGAAAIAQIVLPAHRVLLDFLRDEYIPRAQTSIAAYDLPDGEAFYRALIAKYTTRDMSPEEVHALGLAEVAAIRGEMSEVVEETHFAGDFAAFLNFLRSDPQFYAAEPEELLSRAAAIAMMFDDKAATYFGRLPRQRFAILPVPSEVAPFFTSGRGGLGYFMVNTYDLRSRPLYSLPALTLHESAPGHAFQMALATENEYLPEFRRGTSIAAYSEGWALYCERLGDEMGIYESPYERFGMLSYQMWRAARLVVDTGIHAFGWTRERAQSYLRATTALSEHEIVTEVDRYIAWPGQALSYYIGSMCFSSGRQRAELAVASRFDVRAFHDMLLGLGPVTLDVIEMAIDKFVAANGAGDDGQPA